MIGPNKEKDFHYKFDLFLRNTTFKVITEEKSLRGRADETVITDKFIYIFELKVDKNAKEALNQIKEKKYYSKYIENIKKENKKIILCGINFSSNEKNIESFSYECLS